ncbi:hypothetical protein KY311_01135 [Candidatus Woesearchaeota archaeon]|nr:hypothetical protein [Candidatus Woesearchaeota archaeon]MBW3016891.1 hypothetical protein [Candidatus Woesearchaeota archaeon]
MAFVTYLLLSMAAFAGLVCGIFLAYSNIGELRLGKKYFSAMQKVLLALIIITIMHMYGAFTSVIFSVVSIAAAVLPFFNKKQISLPIMYPLLGMVFYLSSASTNHLISITALIFLFGIPSGTLLKIDKNGSLIKRFPEEVFYSLGFFMWLIAFFA